MFEVNQLACMFVLILNGVDQCRQTVGHWLHCQAN